MRVLYFSRDYTTHDYRFLVELAKTDHEIFYLRLEDDKTEYETRSLPSSVTRLSWAGGSNRVVDIEACMSLMSDFQRVVDEVMPSLIHAGPVHTCGFMTALADFHPFLVMSWASDVLVDSQRGPAWNWITRYALQKSDALLCDSSVVRERVESLVDYHGKRIVQFPWGIDVEHFSPGVGQIQLGESPEEKDLFWIVSTRSWEPIYGIEVLLDAFRIANARSKRLRLLMLGDGSLEEEVEAYIRAHGLDHVILRPGRVVYQKLPDYFRAADLYVSCSHSDGTSISLLEAMGTGLPVAVTDIPGNREWVRNGRHGWLVRPGSSHEFASAFLQAETLSKADLDRIERQNRKVVLDRADWSHNFAQLVSTYQNLVSESSDKLSIGV